MRKKNWQHGLLILASLALVLTLGACGSSSNTATDDGATLTGSAQ